MMKIFVDQSAWTTLLTPAAPAHEKIAREFERALADGDKLFTHNIAVGMAMSQIKRENDSLTANKFYEIIESAYTGAHLSILWIGRRTQKEAVWLMRKHSNLPLDLYDFACFILMRRRRIRSILTTKPSYKELHLSIIPDVAD